MKLSPLESSGLVTAAESDAIKILLAEMTMDSQVVEVTPFAGDGSDRRFLRIGGDDKSVVAVLPSISLDSGKTEARAMWLVGKHLYEQGIPVPELYGFDSTTGVVLCEDLGSRLMQQEILDPGTTAPEIAELYGKAVTLLARMQVDGGKDFDTSYCWDTPRYDRQLMLSRESEYFYEACCRRMFGLGNLPKGLEEEFQELADLAGVASADYFLHRDFQSRNLIIKGGRLRVLDFQGGRLGPLAYDLASLLIDPYVGLDKNARTDLYKKYLEELKLFGIEVDEVAESYYWLALQRNLQIIGAFATLGGERGKPFFLKYLQPAIINLVDHLNDPEGRRFPVLKDLASKLANLVSVRYPGAD